MQPQWLGPSPKLWRARQVQVALPAAALVLAGGIGGGLLAGPVGAFVTVVAVLLVAAAAAWLSRRRFRAWGYAEREDDLLVRRGVMFHRLTVVPYGRMQFVDVTAGPVDRWFGLATVQLHTAAAASDARIPGLEAAEAQRLRDRLARLGEAKAAGL